MGRAKKRDRHGNKHSNSPLHSLDRDDDYLMHGAEDADDSNAASSSNQRGGRTYGRSRSNGQKNERGQDRENSDSNSLLDRFTNPFGNLDLDTGEHPFQSLASGNEGASLRGGMGMGRGRGRGGVVRGQGLVRGRGGYQVHGGHHGHSHDHDNQDSQHENERKQKSKANTNTTTTTATATTTRNKNRNKTRNKHRRDSLPVGATTSPPARKSRFCTECSAVRRANLTLRDWLCTAALRASEVLDGWGDEVGVGRGTGDEMDWQPEPVVRVLILTANTAASASAPSKPPVGTGTGIISIGGGNGGSTSTSPQIGGGGGSDGGRSVTGGTGTGTAAPIPAPSISGTDANDNTSTISSQWGLRPGTLSPGYSGSGWGSTWEGDDVSIVPRWTSAWGQNDTSGGWGNLAPDFQSTAKIMSPPETPPFSSIT